LSGIFILGESFTLDKLIAFGGIWTGLAIFSYSLLQRKTVVPT
jgi:EamA domain-containing membrane protein RarD